MSSSSPLVSVVVPALDVAAYVRRCLDSLLAQDHRPLEIVVVDDGSTDETPAILAEYAAAHPIVRVVRQENAGPGPARNAGIAQATGEFLCVVDADDWVEPDYLSTLVGLALRTDADVAICGFSFDIGRARATFPYVRVPEVMTGPQAARATMQLLRVPPFAWTKLYRREWFVGLGHRYPAIFYEDIGSSTAILYGAGRVAVTSKRLYHYCLRSTGITGDFGVRCVVDYVRAGSLVRAFLEENGLVETWRRPYRRFLLFAEAQVAAQIAFQDSTIRRRDRLRLLRAWHREVRALAKGTAEPVIDPADYPLRIRRRDRRTSAAVKDSGGAAGRR